MSWVGEGDCGCEYVGRGFLPIEWVGCCGREEADGGVCVWVVGSSWLMMLLIRGMSTVSEGRGKAKGNRLTWDHRMNWTMERLKKMEEREYTTLTRVLFGLDTPTPVSQDGMKVEFFDQTLNDSQRDAIKFTLASREVALIHGPPGVGLL